MGRRRFFTSLCKFWVYQSECEAENTCACDVCAFACVSLFARVFWLWFRRGLFSAFEEVQEGEDVFGSSSSCLWLPCRRGHYLSRVLCVRMCLLLVMAQLELCVCLQEQLTPLLLHVKLLGGSLPPWVCVWEWWKLCLMPFTLYFWEIYASGWKSMLLEGLWQDGEQNSEEKYREAL